MEAPSQTVEAARLAVAFRVRHPEVALHVLLGAAPLLVADDHDAPSPEARQPANDGSVVRERAVSVQLLPLLEQVVDVLERVGPVRMARELDLLPRRQIGEELTGEATSLLFQAAELGLELAIALREAAQLLDARYELDDRLFERQHIHRGSCG